jgi:hypothetical protein
VVEYCLFGTSSELAVRHVTLLSPSPVPKMEAGGGFPGMNSFIRDRWLHVRWEYHCIMHKLYFLPYLQAMLCCASPSSRLH